MSILENISIIKNRNQKNVLDFINQHWVIDFIYVLFTLYSNNKWLIDLMRYQIKTNFLR